MGEPNAGVAPVWRTEGGATDGEKGWTSEDGRLWLFTTREPWNVELLGHHVCTHGNRFTAYEPVA